ncbi:hypothetical protein G6F35_012218 [Rhizopus arrhizus]|nr:hypothetical protein G6F35_012218 [Rhizopus arrhizus]
MKFSIAMVSSTWPPKRAAAIPHVEGILGGDFLGIALAGIGVQLGDDLLQGHAALVEHFTVEVHRRHRHDLALLDFVLEQGAVDGHVLDARVEHGGQVQRLHHVRAVLAGQREVGFELEVALQVLHLLDQLGGGLGRVAADLQQRQHQRGELVAHRQAGEGQVDVLARGAQVEGRHAALAVAQHLQRDLVRQAFQGLQQFQHLLRLGAVVGVRGDLDRAGHALQIGLQLRLQVGVQHRVISWLQANRGRGTAVEGSGPAGGRGEPKTAPVEGAGWPRRESIGCLGFTPTPAGGPARG